MSNITGIDISKYQESDVIQPEDKFVIVRLSHGLTEDERATDHIKVLKARKLPFALYHYLEDKGGKTEALFAVSLMEKHGVWGYKLICDFEGTAKLSDAREFIAEAKHLLRPSLWIFRKRMRVGLYSGYAIKANGGETLDAGFGWLADYSSFSRPLHWSLRFTKLWQYTSLSNRGNLDLDKWMGKPTHRAMLGFFTPINRRGFKLRGTII